MKVRTVIRNFCQLDCRCGELAMIYHPEGVIRPRAEEADDNEDDEDDPSEFVYDYFIKDYTSTALSACLGNVRVVLTNEDEVEMLTFLATLKDVHSFIEEEDFDRLDDTHADLPPNYPVSGSAALNERIASLITEDEMTIGPSLVVQTRRGAQVGIAVDYFYEEDAPGATYDNLGFLVDEILVSLAASAAGVIPIGEGQLNNIASGNTPLGGQLLQMLNSAVDTNDLSRPQGYLVYLAFNNENELINSNSGAIQVSNANQLETILRNGIVAKEDGYMHIYVSNGSSVKGINFDNLYVTVLTGKTRQINHYYPYGLPIATIDGNHKKYLNKYTGKEHQTGEFPQFGVASRGIEMFDFDARFFDPQLARWVVPDPALQFSNPYLGIGNNPVMNVDPDGQFAWALPIIKAIAVGGAIGGASYTAQKAFGEGGLKNWEGGQFMKSVGFGALSGGMSYGIGSLNLGDINSTAAHGISQGLISELRGGRFEEGLSAGVFSSTVSHSLLQGSGSVGNSTVGNLAISGLSGGIASMPQEETFGRDSERV
jgi:RHS repeat-associated protein